MGKDGEGRAAEAGRVSAMGRLARPVVASELLKQLCSNGWDTWSDPRMGCEQLKSRPWAALGNSSLTQCLTHREIIKKCL